MIQQVVREKTQYLPHCQRTSEATDTILERMADRIHPDHFQFSQDIPLLTHIEAFLQQLDLMTAPSVALLWNNLGFAWQALGEPQQAIAYFEKALDNYLKNLGDSHPNVARIWNNLGSAWRALGKPQQAIAYFEKSLNGFINTFGESHPHTQTVKENLQSIKNSLLSEIHDE